MLANREANALPGGSWARGLLAGILVCAALLRFSSLDWGLRHAPHMDERYFVENAWRMIAERNLDHGYYEYPGLFFYVLTPALAMIKTAGPPGPGAYAVARGVVAAFGVLNVLLLYWWGRRVAGPRAARAAAALLALSPVDVQTSHMVRADIVLATFVLLGLASLGAIGDSVRGDIKTGFAVGAAAAVKFTGVLLAPAYLIRRLLVPGPRAQGTALAAAAAAAAFGLLSPFALFHGRAFVEGATTQVTYHYQHRPGGPAAPLDMLVSYAAVWPKALGWPAAALALAGLVAVRREWRTWVPFVVLPAATLVVFATQEYRFDRHLVPSLGSVALLAGVSIDSVARRRAFAGAALFLAAASFPAVASVAYLRSISQPGTKDVALDWIEANVPPGARILTTIGGFGLDRRRYEVMSLRRLRPRNRLQLGAVDAIVTSRPGDETLLHGFPPAFVARPSTPAAGRPVRVRLVPAEQRPRLVPVSLEGARFKASQNADALPALRDGRLDTRWEAAPRRGHEEFVRVDLPAPALVGRIELALGDRPDAASRGVVVSLSEDGVHWRRLRPLPGRPGEGQLGAASRLLLFEPIPARAVRIITTGRGRPWAIAELRIDAVSPPAPPPE